MKLHLPKMLLTAVLVASATVQAADGWEYRNNGFRYNMGTADHENHVNISATGKVGNNDIGTSYEIWSDNATDNPFAVNVTSLTMKSGDTLTIRQGEWGGKKDFNPLTIQTLIVDNGGSVNLVVGNAEQTNDKVVINAIQDGGSLSSVSNYGTLTIGTAGSTTTFSGTITNSGTLTLLGTVTVKNWDGFQFSYVGGEDATANGLYDMGKKYTLISGSSLAEGSTTTFTYDGNSYNIADGYTQTEKIYAVISDTVTVGGTNATEGTADADAFWLKGGTLELNVDLNSVATDGIIAAQNSNISIGDKGVLSKSSVKSDGATITLTGSGMYVLGSNDNALGSVSLDTTWAGVVAVSDTSITNANGEVFNFANGYTGLSNTNSWLQISNAKGYLQNATMSANIILVNGAYNFAMKLLNGSTSSSYDSTFSGKISGTGDMLYSWNKCGTNGTDYITLVFSNDTSSWKGKLVRDIDNFNASSAKGKITNVKFTSGGEVFSSESDSAGGVRDADKSGRMNVIINATTNTNFNGSIADVNNVAVESATTFKGDVSASSLTAKANATFNAAVNVEENTTVEGGSKVTFTGTAKLGTLSLGAGLSADTAAVTTSGALTLGSISLDLSSYTTAGSFSLVSKTGDGSINWTEGNWTHTGLTDGLEANVGFNEAGTGLSLTISAIVTPDVKDITTTVLDTSPIWDGTTLTLTVGGNLDGVGSVVIEGFEGDVLDKIFALEGMEANTMVGITLVGADGKVLSAVPVGDISNIGFQGNDGGIYYGQNVGDSTQYNVSYIPEPTTATLSLLALMGLAARRRRK